MGWERGWRITRRTKGSQDKLYLWKLSSAASLPLAPTLPEMQFKVLCLIDTFLLVLEILFCRRVAMTKHWWGPARISILVQSRCLAVSSDHTAGQAGKASGYQAPGP